MLRGGAHSRKAAHMQLLPISNTAPQRLLQLHRRGLLYRRHCCCLRCRCSGGDCHCRFTLLSTSEVVVIAAALPLLFLRRRRVLVVIIEFWQVAPVLVRQSGSQLA